MADDIHRIKTITQLHDILGFEKPRHPLISVMNVEDLKDVPNMAGIRTSADFYLISLKEHDCGMSYGRGHYDFEEGILAFYEPGQVITQTEKIEAGIQSGWMLIFHPDLCLNFFVKFFSY